eukprot:366124-Chlamydomonas_euryale.AAC.12
MAATMAAFSAAGASADALAVVTTLDCAQSASLRHCNEKQVAGYQALQACPPESAHPPARHADALEASGCPAQPACTHICCMCLYVHALHALGCKGKGK